MKNITSISEEDFDRLLAGNRAPGAIDATSLATFVAQVQRASIAASEPEVQRSHLAAIAKANGVVDRTLMHAVPVAAWHSRPKHWLRSFMPSKPPVQALLRTAGMKITAVSMAVLTTTGGLAVAGALPDPAQRAASAGAARIGISLPGPQVDPAVPDEKAEAASRPRGAEQAAVVSAVKAEQAAEEASSAAAAAVGAAQTCLEQTKAAVRMVTSRAKTLRSSEEAGRLVAEAQTIGYEAHRCAEQARALAQASNEQAANAAGQAAGAEMTIADLKAGASALQAIGMASQTTKQAAAAALEAVKAAQAAAMDTTRIARQVMEIATGAAGQAEKPDSSPAGPAIPEEEPVSGTQPADESFFLRDPSQPERNTYFGPSYTPGTATQRTGRTHTDWSWTSSFNPENHGSGSR